MKNEWFHIGPFTVYGYGTMIAAAMLTAYFTITLRAKRLRMEDEHVFPLFVWCLAGGIAGAKLMFLVVEWRDFFRDPLYYLLNPADGFVVYGGILLGILTGYLYCRVNALPFARWSDLILPSVALAQGVGRIGCFFAGCCYGRECDGPFCIVFRHSEFAPNNVPLVPTQLLSSFLDFVHFGLLLLIARRKKKDGQVTACYLLLYGAGRFAMEFLRGDLERGAIGVLSTSQFISLFLIAAGAYLLFTKKVPGTG